MDPFPPEGPHVLERQTIDSIGVNEIDYRHLEQVSSQRQIVMQRLKRGDYDSR